MDEVIKHFCQWPIESMRADYGFRVLGKPLPTFQIDKFTEALLVDSLDNSWPVEKHEIRIYGHTEELYSGIIYTNAT